MSHVSDLRRAFGWQAVHFIQFILSSLCECRAVLLAAHCYIKRSCHKHSEYNLNTFLCFLSCQNHRIQDSLGRKPSRTLLVKVSLIVAWKPHESAQCARPGKCSSFTWHSDKIPSNILHIGPLTDVFLVWSRIDTTTDRVRSPVLHILLMKLKPRFCNCTASFFSSNVFRDTLLSR